MKKILMIRSANIITMDKLINYISEKYNDLQFELYVLIQKGSIKSFSEKYPNINYIEKEDGFFNYSNFKKNKELISKFKELVFDEIYIPSSGLNFDGFEETFLIANTIKLNKYILFNSEGEIQSIKLNYFNLIIEKYLGNYIYGIKVLVSLIIISLIYIVYYPYCILRNTLTVKEK